MRSGTTKSQVREHIKQAEGAQSPGPKHTQGFCSSSHGETSAGLRLSVLCGVTAFVMNCPFPLFTHRPALVSCTWYVLLWEGCNTKLVHDFILACKTYYHEIVFINCSCEPTYKCFHSHVARAASEHVTNQVKFVPSLVQSLSFKCEHLD